MTYWQSWCEKWQQTSIFLFYQGFIYKRVEIGYLDKKGGE
jgi:hypothetical protein